VRGCIGPGTIESRSTSDGSAPRSIVRSEDSNGLPPIAFHLEGKGFSEWIPAALQWLSSVGKPLVIGLPLLAVILAVAGYFVVDYAWQLHVRYEWSRRRRRHASRRSGPS
jgi:hypothetical protein